MGYTQERLDHALQVFRESRAYRERRGIKTGHLEQHIKSRLENHIKEYALRASRASGYGPRMSVWDDKDESGDYNPSKEKKRSALTLSRSRKPKRRASEMESHGNQDRKDKKPKIMTWQQGRQRGLIKKITLRLESGKGRAFLLRLVGETGAERMDHAEGSAQDESSDADGEDELSIEGLNLRTRTVPGLGQTGLKHTLKQQLESEADESSAGGSRDAPISISSPVFSFGGEIETIRTNWAHPVDYKFQPPADNSVKCHFCQDYRYGIFGCGTIGVEVIKYPNSVAYEEMGNGHRAQGKEATRMCLSCALDRLTIMRCREHEIYALGDHEEDALDFQAAFEHLMQARAKERSAHAQHAWCSLCVNPALYVCGRMLSTDRWGKPLAPGMEESGCGLMLCITCAGVLQDHGMNQKMIEQAAEEEGSALRADFDLIFAGSDLQKAYLT